MSSVAAPLVASAPQAGAPARFRAALEYALDGDLRFLSHRDELRMLVRALVRARWPLAYSQGFNPQPHLTLPLPRNLGTAAAGQLGLVDLREPRPPEELFESLRRALPTECALQYVIAPALRGMPHAQSATYAVRIDPEEAIGLGARIAGLLARSTVVVQRDCGPKKPPRTIDIRPYVEMLELEGCVLRLRLRFVQQRTARPSEVLSELGLAAAVYNHRLLRREIHWDIELTGPAFGPALHERTSFDPKEQHDQEYSSS